MNAGDPSAHAPERGILERDLTRFLVDLSIALHRFAMYPPGHPSLSLGLETLGRRVEVLLQHQAKIAIGVARDRLVIEGVVTDERQPLLSALAERLHRHHLSALVFCRGVSIEELRHAVAAIARDPAGESGPLGRPGGTPLECPHVMVYPLSVGALEMVDEGGGQGAVACRSAELWIGLAQAALGGDDRPVGAQPGPAGPALELPIEPALVARAIDEHQPVEAYDQVIVGYLQQIAEETRAARSPEAAELKRRVSALVSSMQPGTLRRLLLMGGDAARRREFLRMAAAGVNAGAVVDLVQAAANASNGALSNGLVRLLGKLAAHADAGVPDVRPLADSALRLQVERLTAGWDLADPNPDDYTGVLERIAQEPSRGAREGPGEEAGCRDPLRVVLMCLELGETGPALGRAVAGLAECGQLAEAVSLLGSGDRAEPAESKAWALLTSAETLARLLARVPPDFAGVDVLLPHLRGVALAPLFVALIDSEDLRVRRAAFDRLHAAGPEASALALDRLASEERWYGVRNLLALLAEAEHVPDRCDPLPWLAHEDARVRREAVRLALRLPALRDHALAQALADADERVLSLALKAAVVEPARGTGRRLFDLAGREALDDELRAMAIEALVRVHRGPEVAGRLLELVTRDSRWLGWAAGREERSRASSAALTALAAHWGRTPEVAAVLRRAAAPEAPGRRLAGQGRRP